MELDKNLVKKYLNYKAVNLEFDSQIDNVFKELLSFCQPKKMCVLSDCHVENGFYYLDNLNITLQSNDINNLFFECEKIATLVVTLGLEVDKKIDFYSKTDMNKSLILDAVSSVYVESVLDELEGELVHTMADMYPTMRFSAGYGDLDIKLQKQIISSTGADKYLGISVNDNYLMKPNKSITAFIGFSKQKQVFSDICLTCPQKAVCKIKCSRARG